MGTLLSRYQGDISIEVQPDKIKTDFELDVDPLAMSFTGPVRQGRGIEEFLMGSSRLPL